MPHSHHRGRSQRDFAGSFIADRSCIAGQGAHGVSGTGRAGKRGDARGLDPGGRVFDKSNFDKSNSGNPSCGEPSCGKFNFDRSSVTAQPVFPEAPSQAPEPALPQVLVENILRVDAERIDTVLNLVGELIIGKSMLQQALNEFGALSQGSYAAASPMPWPFSRGY